MPDNKTGKSEIMSQISVILSDLLDRDDIKLTEKTRAEQVDGWDSIKHVELIVAIEAAYKIRFESAEISAPENVGALVDLIAKKLVAA